MSPERRAELIERRKVEFPAAHPGALDFMPDGGRCWSCRLDLVDYYGERYPVIYVSCCPRCRRSFDD